MRFLLPLLLSCSILRAAIPTTNTFSNKSFRVTTSKIYQAGSVEGFGAIGSGVVNDTAAVQFALDSIHAAGGGTVIVPTGIYVVSNLVIYANTTLQGDGASSILKQISGATYVLSVNPGTGGTSNPADNTTNIVIRNLRLEGRAVEDGFSEHRHLLNINAATDVTVDNVDFIAPQGDGIYLGSSNQAATERHNQRVRIVNCRGDGVNKANRNWLTVIDCDGLLVQNCKVKRFTKSGMPGPIDVEPNGDTFTVLKNLDFDNNYFSDNGGTACIGIYIPEALSMIYPLNSITIQNNAMGSDNTGYSIYCKLFNTSPSLITQNSSQNNIVVENNAFDGGGCVFEGINGLYFHHNAFHRSGVNCVFVGSVTQNDGCNTVNWTISDCHFSDTGGDYGAICIGMSSYGKILRNVFSNIAAERPSHFAIVGLGAVAATTSSDITIADNQFAGVFTRHLYPANHTFTTDTIYAHHNVIGGGGGFTAPAGVWIVDSGLTLEDLTTPPDSFHLGQSVNYIGSDGTAPNYLGEGTLVTIKTRSAAGYRGYCTQYFYQSGGTNEFQVQNPSQYWFRSARSSTNAWDSWQSSILLGSYTSTNTPSNLPVGQSFSIVNYNDTNIPGLFPQSTLQTIKGEYHSGYRKFITQINWESYTHPEQLGGFQFRKGIDGGDSWSPWLTPHHFFDARLLTNGVVYPNDMLFRPSLTLSIDTPRTILYGDLTIGTNFVYDSNYKLQVGGDTKFLRPAGSEYFKFHMAEDVLEVQLWAAFNSVEMGTSLTGAYVTSTADLKVGPNDVYTEMQKDTGWFFKYKGNSVLTISTNLDPVMVGIGSNPKFLSFDSSYNFGLGKGAMADMTTSGTDSIAIGTRAMEHPTALTDSIAIGGRAMDTAASGADYNIVIGHLSGNALASANNIIIGRHSAQTLTNGYNVIIGNDIGVSNGLINGTTNSISIGYGALSHSTNTITLGNAAMTHIFMPTPVIPTHTPANSSETNYVGAITWDASYLYIWTAENVNKRVPLNTW